MSPARYCSGFTLVSAIFLLVVLAALGVYMVTISGVQQATTSHAVIAARTYYAAKSGLEWAINRGVNTPSGGGGVRDFPIVCGNATFTDPSLPNISITITCSHSRQRDGDCSVNDPFNALVITSTAEYGAFGNPDYARRHLEATVSNCFGPRE